MSEPTPLAEVQNELLSRKQWSLACQFHERNTAQILDEISTRVSAGIQTQTRPIVIFDLDSTLYEVGPRTFRIMQDWAESDQSGPHSELKSRVQALSESQVRYSVPETLEEALSGAIQKLEGVQSIQSFWFERFFTDDYLAFDRLYPGAAEFVLKVFQTGADVVYLTGRDEPGMGRGTVQNLIRDGLPWNSERTHLLMKPRFAIPDLEFKLQASSDFCRSGALVASFENEPPNIAGLYRLFPEAMHVFVDTVCGNHGAIPYRGLYRIEDWFTER